MLFEDVAGEAGSGLNDAFTSQDSTSRRLKNTHRRALRANHLRHNRYLRPRRMVNQRRLEDNADTPGDLMDALSVTGGYNGGELFIKLELDVSKLSVDSIDDLIRKPFEILENAEFIVALFPSTNNSTEGESLLNHSASFSVSASAHVCVRGENFSIEIIHDLLRWLTHYLCVDHYSGDRYNSVRSEGYSFLLRESIINAVIHSQ